MKPSVAEDIRPSKDEGDALRIPEADPLCNVASEPPDKLHVAPRLKEC
ncbi:MAG: hypothetical protein WCL44_03910 [bacterium]